MTNESKPKDLLGLQSDESAPSIPAPGRKWITRLALPGLILLSMAGLLVYGARDALIPAVDVEVVDVVVKTLKPDKPIDPAAPTEPGDRPAVSGSVVVQAPGWLEADPYPTYVSALTDGVIDRVLVLEGERVTRGQVVAEMIDDDAKLAVERAVADLATAEARLEAAKTEWENPVARRRLVAVQQANLAETRAQKKNLLAIIEQETATVAELQAIYDGYKALPSSATSKLEVETARYRLQASRAKLKASREMIEQFDAQSERFEAEVAAAKEDLRLRIVERRELDEAKAAHDQAEAKLAEAKLRLERMQVRSPAAGVVMQRLAIPGAKLMLAMDSPHSAHVVHLYDPQRLQVRVDVPLGEAAKVGVGQAARVIVEVLPDTTFNGHVSRIVHQADIEKNTLEVKVAIANPTDELKPEMLARVKFLSGGAPSEQTTATVDKSGTVGLYLPQSLVDAKPGSQTDVWLYKRADSTAVRRTITLGAADASGWIRITEGLKPGDAVIVDPPQDLRADQRVRILGRAEPKL